ncbi:MAG: choice-of-anchor U domain-containing protein [Desulfobacteria bacterium]
MGNVLTKRSGNKGKVLFFFFLFAAIAIMAPNANASSSYFNANCSGCHIGQAGSNFCGMCHAHGTHASSSKTGINVAGATNKTSYAAGETVSVTITGGYRPSQARAILYDQNGVQLAISTGSTPSTTDGPINAPVWPVTLSAPAPTASGTYTWQVAWYGNQYDIGSATFGTGWKVDPNNPGHGWQTVSTSSFTVATATKTLNGIAISGPASVNESATATYAATATWSDGTTTTVTPTWTTTLGTISASGVLTAPSVTANQTATVGASYASGGVTRTASVSVTIANVAATLNGIAISGPASVNESATATYAATATWSDGTNTSVSPTWTVSPTTYASVNASGVLTTLAVTSNQSVTVTASYTADGVTKTNTKTVTIVDVAATLDGIAINGAGSVNENSTAIYTASANWGDGTTTQVSPSWSVSPTTYANVSTSGVLTTLAVTSNQSVTLTASYTSGGMTRTATKAVSIVDVNSQAGTLSVMPPDNTVDVPVNTVIVVRNGGIAGIDTIFNRNTFTLKPDVPTSDSSVTPSEPYRGSVCVSDGIVQGSFRYNWNLTSGTFIPNCSLANGATYIGTITMAAGSPLTAPFAWQFTTIAGSTDSDDDGSYDTEDDHPDDARRASLWTPTGTGKIHIDANGSTATSTSSAVAGGSTPSIKSAMAISDGSARLNQAGAPGGYEFPDGMVSFRAMGVPSGGNATVTITFPTALPAGGKVYQADAIGFHEVPGAVFNGNALTMTIPGGAPSADAAQDNGILIDPIGVASPETSGGGTIDLTSSSSGGGCSIVGGTRSGGSNIDAFLILAGLGAISWRRRIRHKRK